MIAIVEVILELNLAGAVRRIGDGGTEQAVGGISIIFL